VTTSGLYALIVALDDNVVTLQTAPGQQVRWDRRAIARLVEAEADPSAESSTADALPVDALNDPTDQK
jgi:preprotein translocase subunit YajC